jgi:2-oxoisovalerate dehydrogenase E1 component alpha subunit
MHLVLPQQRVRNTSCCSDFSDLSASEYTLILLSHCIAAAHWSCSFAISTPIIDQYAGDGIASRGPGYGLDTIRVDGNDALGVLSAVREARRRAVEGKKGVWVEAMTYRVGHHSTSDDSSKYRPMEEVQEWTVVGESRRRRLESGLHAFPAEGNWLANSDNPLYRFRAFLVARGWWSEAEEAALLKKNKSEVLKTFSRAEKLPKPKLGEMFNDVWAVQKGEEMPSVIVSDAAQRSCLVTTSLGAALTMA